MRIARVFPSKTSMCPTDRDAYFNAPDMFTPQYDEVHISVTFTWDILKAKALANAWKNHGLVKIGGVGIDGESAQPFKAGMYLRRGIVIDSRGCGNGCTFCVAGKTPFIEFDDFDEGNIIQSNNVLRSSTKHWCLLLNMLKKQKAIEFKGGLDKYRVTPKIAEELRGLSIKSLWLACDQKEGIKPLETAVNILKQAGFTRSHLYCYVLIGDDARENIHRLKDVFKIGCMPFAQLFKPGEYSKSWKRFQRRWAKPMIIRKRCVRFNLTREAK